MMILLPGSGYSQKVTINIVTDQAYWYPFIYSQNDLAKGIHIDIVKKALLKLNYIPKFYPKPWKRCLRDIKKGSYDGIVSASCKPERAEYLIYPEDAKNLTKSLWRITQVEYIAITYFNSSYIFNGDVKSLPLPVRAPLGYSIVDDLKAAGIHVLEAPDTIDCARQLIKSKRGSFITHPQNAIGILYDNQFKGKLKIHPQPIKSKSYFMAFSIRNQKFDRKIIMEIWNEIVKVRNDKDFMKGLYNKYNG